MRHIALIALAVGALLVGGLVAPAHAGDIRFGRLWAADKVLREGCHNYRYQYVVRPPTNDWSFETFLHDPSGETIASERDATSGSTPSAAPAASGSATTSPAPAGSRSPAS